MVRLSLLMLAITATAPGSILMNSLVPAGGFDASVRIGNGTGTIFMTSAVDNLLTLCIVTADHVLGGLSATGGLACLLHRAPRFAS